MFAMYRYGSLFYSDTVLIFSGNPLKYVHSTDLGVLKPKKVLQGADFHLTSKYSCYICRTDEVVQC